MFLSLQVSVASQLTPWAEPWWSWTQNPVKTFWIPDPLSLRDNKLSHRKVCGNFLYSNRKAIEKVILLHKTAQFATVDYSLIHNKFFLFFLTWLLCHKIFSLFFLPPWLFFLNVTGTIFFFFHDFWYWNILAYISLLYIIIHCLNNYTQSHI